MSGLFVVLNTSVIELFRNSTMVAVSGVFDIRSENSWNKTGKGFSGRKVFPSTGCEILKLIAKRATNNRNERWATRTTKVFHMMGIY